MSLAEVVAVFPEEVSQFLETELDLLFSLVLIVHQVQEELGVVVDESIVLFQFRH